MESRVHKEAIKKEVKVFFKGREEETLEEEALGGEFHKSKNFNHFFVF